MGPTTILLAFGLAAVAAAPKQESRIVGGSITTIGNYPMGVAMLFSWSGSGTFRQNCGGSILNNRAILTAAHCTIGDPANRWRGRVGSSRAHSGGVVHTISRIINHAQYNPNNFDNDIAICHTSAAFNFNNNVRAGAIAGAGYNPPDNAPVWAIGWGLTAYRGQPSEDLRHVQVWVINQAICRQRYAERRNAITDNMLCSGYLDRGGRDQCSGDSGGPLFHNRVIVGVCSFGYQCAHPRFPGVNARVSRYTNWIRANQ